VTVAKGCDGAAGARRPLALLAGPAAGVTGLVLLLLCLSAGLLATVDDLWPLTPGPDRSQWLGALAIAALFCAAERCTVHIETGRSAHTVNLREVPLVLGLAFLSPLAFLGAHVLGSTVALAVGSRRERWLKFTFNVALVALQGSLALVVYGAAAGTAGAAEVRGWLATFVAVVVCDLVGAAAVTAAIALHSGDADASVVREAATTGLVAALANTSLAVLAVVLLIHQPPAALLLLVAYAVLFIAYRGYTRLNGHYRRTELLYEFSHRLGESVESDAVIQVVLDEARKLLHASVAELVLLDGAGAAASFRSDGPSAVLSTRVEDTDVSTAWWLSAVGGASVVQQRTTGKASHPDGAAVLVRLDGENAGALLVSDRTTDVSTFGWDDLRLLEALAAHAGVALQNGRLVDRLRTEAADKGYRAVHDALTGLPNRLGIERALADRIAQGPVGVLVVEVERFDDTSATLGFDLGDRLLVEAGRRLSGVAAPAGEVGRLEGGSFAIMIPGDSGRPGLAGLQAAASHLRAAFADALVIGDLTLYASINIGVSLAPLHGTDPAALLQQADIAMRHAKERHSSVGLYHPLEGERRRRRLTLATDLRHAVQDRSVQVWYQPKADACTGRVTGAEALVRWKHPKLGFIPADELVATADRTGLLPELTLHVLRTALAQAATWNASGRSLRVAVNLSVGSLADEKFPDTVREALAKSGVPAESLTLEITESTLMEDADESIAVLERLAAMGVRLSIDDFGTGYSSLAYLQRLPVHELKIDKSFVLGIGADGDAPIVQTTIDLAHRLGRSVVAEGVETVESWNRLRDMGADTIQGYLLLRPSPADAFDTWLRAYEETGMRTALSR
jgi:diguanylate cyclase (GGDEF)-like protein